MITRIAITRIYILLFFIHPIVHPQPTDNLKEYSAKNHSATSQNSIQEKLIRFMQTVTVPLSRTVPEDTFNGAEDLTKPMKKENSDYLRRKKHTCIKKNQTNHPRRVIRTLPKPADETTTINIGYSLNAYPAPQKKKRFANTKKCGKCQHRFDSCVLLKAHEIECKKSCNVTAPYTSDIIPENPHTILLNNESKKSVDSNKLNFFHQFSRKDMLPPETPIDISTYLFPSIDFSEEDARTMYSLLDDNRE